MSIKIRDLSVANFGNFKSFNTKIYERTSIEGSNEVGKSTLRNAIFWLLTNKMADGSSPDGIRPHDQNGKDIDFVDIEVKATLDVDGVEYIVKKVQAQKWTKSYGETEKRFNGNVNTYEINGIPKKEKDFNTFMESIVSPDVLLFGMNAMSLLTMPTKKMRDKIFSLDGNYSDEEVIKKNPEYASLPLADGTPDELIARSKRTIKALNAELSEIPARIDELEKTVNVIDTDALKKELEVKKKTLEEQTITVGKLTEQIDRLEKESDGILELQFKKNDLTRLANQSNEEKRIKTRKELNELESNVFVEERNANQCKDDIESLTAGNSTIEHNIAAEKERKLSLKTLICPTCGREYEAEKKAEIKEKFNAEKKDRLKLFNERLKANNKKIRELNRIISEKTEILEKLNKRHDELKEVLRAIPDSVDISNSESYKALEREIAEKEKIRDELSKVQETNKAETLKLYDISSEVTSLINTIHSVDTSNAVYGRIEELRVRQKEIAQKIAEEEKQLDLIQQFNVDKINTLTDRVNSHFNIVKWVMFKQQINGAWVPCCEPTVNGSNYFSTLNHGNKLLSEIDICLAFQKANGIDLPIMVDDMESVDDWRIPQVDTQLIVLRRTDNKKLTVKEI